MELYTLDRGANGVTYRDFSQIPEYKRDVIKNRTQEKRENGVYERESESPGASQ